MTLSPLLRLVHLSSFSFEFSSFSFTTCFPFFFSSFCFLFLSSSSSHLSSLLSSFLSFHHFPLLPFSLHSPSLTPAPILLFLYLLWPNFSSSSPHPLSLTPWFPFFHPPPHFSVAAVVLNILWICYKFYLFICHCKLCANFFLSWD